MVVWQCQKCKHATVVEPLKKECKCGGRYECVRGRGVSVSGGDES